MLLTPSIFASLVCIFAVTVAGDDEVCYTRPAMSSAVGSLRWKIVWLGAWGVG
jgi:hypothetical protein